MRIGIDVDEVLANFNEALCNFHNSTYNTNLTRKDFKDFYLADAFKCSEEEVKERMQNFFLSPFFKQIKPIEGAKEAIIELSKNNELIIITARPEVLRKDTEEWLESYFPAIFKRVHISQSKFQKGLRKWQICKDEKVDIHIDDGLHIIKDCSKNNIKSIVFDNPWNREFTPKNAIRVKDWYEALEYFRSL